MNKSITRRNSIIREIVEVALMSVLITVCAWISIPLTVSFTLQTFAIYFILRVSGGKKGLISIILYILLGIIGVPVFSGFKGGLGVLLGPTGGYIVGFVLIGILYLLFEKLFNNKIIFYVILFTGLILCYLFGTIWFTVVMASGESKYSFWEALLICVIPFIIPDIIKIILSQLIGSRVLKIINKDEDNKKN